ncbi:MAG: hypothetical protein WKF78_13090 [Candidatus Limnocylindrales bacterium]
MPMNVSSARAARVGLGLEQVVQPLVPQPLDVVRRERRPEQDLREEFHRRGQA